MKRRSYLTERFFVNIFFRGTCFNKLYNTTIIKQQVNIKTDGTELRWKFETVQYQCTLFIIILIYKSTYMIDILLHKLSINWYFIFLSKHFIYLAVHNAHITRSMYKISVLQIIFYFVQQVWVVLTLPGYCYRALPIRYIITFLQTLSWPHPW